MSDDKKNEASFVYTRKYPRVPLSLMIRVRAEGQVGKSYHSKDLSAGGVFILSAFPLEEETQVTLELYLPKTEKPVKLKGEVVWKQRQEPAGFAVKFVEITEAERSLLRAVIPPPAKTD